MTLRSPNCAGYTPACAGLAITTVLALSIGAAVASPAPPRGKVVALDARTGRAAWEAPLWSHSDAAVPPLVADDRVYVLEEGKTLKALDASTGRPCWQVPVASTLPLTLAGNLVVAVAGDTVLAFNSNTGIKAWEFSPRFYPEWKFDAHTIPVVAPTRLLLPAGNTIIAIDPKNGQPVWAYTVTASVLPLRPVVAGEMVYINPGRGASPVRLKLRDGLPNTGEYALPPDVARAMGLRKQAAPDHRPSPAVKQPVPTVKAIVAPGGKALAAAGARRWRFPAPAGWVIDRVAGEAAGHVYALLGLAPGPNQSAVR